MDEVIGKVCEALNKGQVHTLPNPYWPLVQLDAPWPDVSHFWHLCIRPARQGDAVHVPLLKLKQNCWAGRVHDDEDAAEAELAPDLEDLEAEPGARGKGIR